MEHTRFNDANPFRDIITLSMVVLDFGGILAEKMVMNSYPRISHVSGGIPRVGITLPLANDISAKILRLPIYPALNQSDIMRTTSLIQN